MEAGEAELFLGKIRPPRLEDAGLEDCALPPESIKEAFLKAAAAVKSVISTVGEGVGSEVRCVGDPWEESSDVLVGITEGMTGPSEGCIAEKGGRLTEAPGDKLTVGVGIGGYGDTNVDTVVGPGLPVSEEACVDGLQGLENNENPTGSSANKLSDLKDDEDDEGNGPDRPTLAEGYAV